MRYAYSFLQAVGFMRPDVLLLTLVRQCVDKERAWPPDLVGPRRLAEGKPSRRHADEMVWA